MTQQSTVEDLILDIMRKVHVCDLEEIASQRTDLTWNQVFLAVDRLSRNGKVMLVPRGRGFYTVIIPQQQEGRPNRRSLPS